MSDKPADSSISVDTTLVVFCRRPVPGVGKRRIARHLGDESTFELAVHLLACVVEDARAWPGPVIISPACNDDRQWAGELLPGRADVIPQTGGNLGERLNAVDATARASGHTRLAYVGSDAPTLTSGYYAAARAALAAAEVVLGPAEDGGVTLMASACAWPNLKDLPWSENTLGRQLERVCVAAGLTTAKLERNYDIDLATDLARLDPDLTNDPRPARQALRDWLQRNREYSATPDRARA
jgi:glycosyltransferase A (GT-A) superfamily protein (DUF2064 family)